MRAFKGVNLKTIHDPLTRQALLNLDTYARQTGRALSRSIGGGANPGAITIIQAPGGPGSQTTEFVDTTFKIQDEGTPSKKVRFEVGGVTPGTTRVLTIPDASGTIALVGGGGIADHDHSVGNGGNIPETSITDGSLLARLAANETVAGDWTFTSINTLMGAVSISNPDTTITRNAPGSIQVEGNTVFHTGNIVPIANGGTNANNAIVGFDNLSPMTTAGDLISHNGASNARLAIGSPGEVLTAVASGPDVIPQWLPPTVDTTADVTITGDWTFQGDLIGPLETNGGGTYNAGLEAFELHHGVGGGRMQFCTPVSLTGDVCILLPTVDTELFGTDSDVTINGAWVFDAGGSGTAPTTMYVNDANGTFNDSGLVLWNGTERAQITMSASQSSDGEIALPNCSGTSVRLTGGNIAETISAAWNFTTAPQVASLEVGHATDTTLTRSSAGNLAVEGNLLYRAGGTDVPVADGGTGASTLTDRGVLVGRGTSAVEATAAGATNTVLRGQGASTNPDFGAINKSYLDNRTRNVSLPIGCWETNSKVLGGSAPDSAAYITFNASTFTRTYAVFRVPDDYAGNPEMQIGYAASGTSVIDFIITLHTRKLTTSTSVFATADTADAPACSPSGVTDRWTVHSIPMTTSIAAGDYLRFTIERDGASDTNPNAFRMFVANFVYTADM